MKSLPDQNLARLQDAYQQTGIVLYAWEAVLFCHANELPIPAWVLGYLVTSAEKVLSLGKARQPGRFPRQAREIGIALGFAGRRGRPNVFEQVKRRDRIEKVVR